MYDNAEYAHSRLSGTIIRLTNRGTPITVTGCENGDEDIRVFYRTLSSSKRGQCNLNEVNLVPVSLGWVNDSSMDASYLARMPLRSDYRQGLRSHNYISLYGPEKRYVENVNLSRTIQNKFFNVDSAIEEATNVSKITAFSRDFSIGLSKNGMKKLLYFKWYGVVGDIVNDQISLSDEYSHLTETLEGVL